jgi:hypothetical protein
LCYPHLASIDQPLLTERAIAFQESALHHHSVYNRVNHCLLQRYKGAHGMERTTIESKSAYLALMNAMLHKHHGYMELKNQGYELAFTDIMPNLQNSYGVTMPPEKAHKKRAEQIYEEVLVAIGQQYACHAEDGKGDDEETDTSVTG